MKNRAIRISFAVLSLFATVLTAQAEYRWVCLTANEFEKAIDTAKNYSDATMWTEGEPANEAGALAYFRPTKAAASNWGGGVRYTILDLPITVGKIVRNFDNTRAQDTFDANRRWLIAGDNEITLESTGEVSLVGLGICGPVRVNAGTVLKLGAVDLCGPLSNDAGLGMTIVQGQSTTSEVRFRRDRWAADTSAVISNVAPQTVEFDASNVLSITCPRGNEALNGVWTTTEGDSRLRYVSGPVADELSVGSVVTGEGIPDGAFVKYIYPDGTIALSAPATASSSEDGVELAFGAFAPVMYQNIASVVEEGHTATSYTYGFKFGKSRAEDEFTVDIGKLFTTYGYRLRYLVFDTDAGQVPARVRVHNASAFNSAVRLGTCDLEFPGTNTAVTAGVVHSTAFVTMGSAAAVAKVSVPDGVTAHFNSVTNFIGTFEKQGEGTLVFDKVRGLAADETGVIRIDAGELAFTAVEGADAAATVSALEIAAGAKLTLDGFTLTAKAAKLESGARIEGAGRLVVPVGTDVSALEIGSGVTIGYEYPAEMLPTGEFVRTVTPVTEETLPAEPAIWIDASQADTLERAVIDGVEKRGRCVRWWDRRGHDYGALQASTYGSAYASTVEYYPQIVTNTDGTVSHVYLASANTTENSKLHAFKTVNAEGTHRTLSNVREIFKVQAIREGMPTMAGLYVNKTFKGLATPSTLYTGPVFKDTDYTSGVVFRVNGEVRDWHDGYPYKDSATKVDDYAKTVSSFELPGDLAVWGFGYSAKAYSGRERLYEMLVFTNALTRAERVAVTAYLMRKWQNASTDFDDGPSVASVAYEANGSVVIPEGRYLHAAALSGAGAFEKTGGGTLALDGGLGDATRTVKVSEGVLDIRSRRLPTEAELPPGRAIHIDAGNFQSLTLEGEKVVSVADTRGSGFPVAVPFTGTSGSSQITYLSSAFDGQPVLDFGNCAKIGWSVFPTQGGGCLTFDELPVQTAFNVFGTSETRNGGTMLGWVDETDVSTAGGVEHGLVRTLEGATFETPLAQDVGDAYRLTKATVAGSPRMRLDGADVMVCSTGAKEGYQVFSFADYNPTPCNAFSAQRINEGKSWYQYAGGQLLSESILYTNTLSRSEVRTVEDYLRNKWFGETPVGYEQAAVGLLEVGDGAEVRVSGNQPLLVTGLKGAGTVDGAVAFAADAVFTVTVGEDGTLSVPTVSGGFDVSAGGTVLLVGAPTALEPGTYDLGAVKAAEAYGTWTAVAETPIRKLLSVAVSDGHLVLTVTPRGMLLLVK